MKKILISIFFVLISNALCAQDLIVTNYYPNVRIATVGGYSLRTRLPKNSWDDSYYKDMKNGWHYGIELNYFFTESLGIGMNFYSSHFKAEDRNGINKVRIQHFIPTFTARDFDKQKRGALLLSVGIGYINYRMGNWDTFYPGKPEGIITDKAIGLLCGIGYDFPMSQTIAIYLQASYIGDLSFLFTSYSDSLGRINLSGGFRFSI